jgi:hypothetical protein
MRSMWLRIAVRTGPSYRRGHPMSRRLAAHVSLLAVPCSVLHRLQRQRHCCRCASYQVRVPDQPKPTIKDPVEVLADRLSALDETALRHFAYALAYAPNADLSLLRSKVGEAEEWSVRIAADFPAIFGRTS